MDEIFQALIDRTRGPLNLDRIKTIFGDKNRPHYDKRKKNPTRWGVVVEKPAYDVTIFKVHYGKMTLKIYTKGERVLRIEVIVHNTKAKGLVEKIGASRRYEPLHQGLRAMTALVVLREKVIRPMLAASTRPEPLSKLSNPTPIDQHYETLRAGMRSLFTELGVAA